MAVNPYVYRDEDGDDPRVTIADDRGVWHTFDSVDAARRFGESVLTVTGGRSVDAHALRQMTYEALTSYPARLHRVNPTATDRQQVEASGAHNAMLRSIAMLLGGTYHAGYDRPAADAWRALFQAVHDTVSRADQTMTDMHNVYPTDVERVSAELLQLVVSDSSLDTVPALPQTD